MSVNKCGECDGSVEGVAFREVIRDTLALHESCYQGMSAPRLARLMGFSVPQAGVEESFCFYDGDGDPWVYVNDGWYCIEADYEFDMIEDDYSSYEGFDSWVEAVAVYGVQSAEQSYSFIDQSGDTWTYVNGYWFCVGRGDWGLAVVDALCGVSAYPGLDSWEQAASDWGIRATVDA